MGPRLAAARLRFQAVVADGRAKFDAVRSRAFSVGRPQVSLTPGASLIVHEAARQKSPTYGSTISPDEVHERFLASVQHFGPAANSLGREVPGSRMFEAKATSSPRESGPHSKGRILDAFGVPVPEPTFSNPEARVPVEKPGRETYAPTSAKPVQGAHLNVDVR
jgi:hypothetical protein